MRTINSAIVHCSDTYDFMDIGVSDIRAWHIERGFDDIGYHYVIRRDGTLEFGRELNTPGAHAKGHNANSAGICLVGGKGANFDPEFNYTQAQMKKLGYLIAILRDMFPGLDVFGHNEVSEKACPCFDVRQYFGETV